MNTLEVKNASVDIGSKTLLGKVSLSLKPGEVISVLGPNGAGKSTLMNVLSGERKLSEGSVILNGRSDWSLSQKALMMGVLPQSSSLNFPFTVEEVVMLGRIPCATRHEENLKITTEALKKIDSLHLLHRQYTTLSGGERQRVHMARVLAQIWNNTPLGSRYLLLDEPTSALDPAHQQLTLKVARQQADSGLGVLIILHDLNLAARYSDRIIILNNGSIAAQGAPEQVLTPEIVYSVFDIDVRISQHPIHDCALVVNI